MSQTLSARISLMQRGFVELPGEEMQRTLQRGVKANRSKRDAKNKSAISLVIKTFAEFSNSTTP